MVICESNSCTGCGACENVCPRKCIKLIEDSDGFSYPVIDNKICIRCGKCQDICIANNNFLNEVVGKPYLAWHKNDEIIYNSSSGGMHYALAKRIIEQKGIVIGAEYREDWSVHHTAISHVKDIVRHQKSKYMQSSLNGIYDIIAENIVKKKVLFTGTPCQCAAIKSVFHNNTNFDNLYLVDLICHGVQSPKVALSGLAYMEKKYNGKCKKMDFRSKKHGWANACTAEMEFSNGKNIDKRINDIPIGSAFLKNLSVRACCEKCNFRSLERVGDITIGDFWTIRNDREFLKKNKDKGFSSVLINSGKGSELFLDILDNLNYLEKSIEDVKKDNNPLWKQFTPNPNREKFFYDFSRYDFEEIYRKYLKPDRKKNVIRRLKLLGKKLYLDNLYHAFRG